jgi:hypothetical protein
MNKVALKTIGFVEQNEANDQWTQQQEQQLAERSLPQDIYIDGIHRFHSIDQDNSSMTEDLDIGEEGNKYRQEVQFVVRTEYDRKLAKKYERRPLVLHVWAVNGDHYKIGTPSYPAYLIPAKSNSMDAVETAMTVDYETLTPLM